MITIHCWSAYAQPTWPIIAYWWLVLVHQVVAIWELHITIWCLIVSLPWRAVKVIYWFCHCQVLSIESSKLDFGGGLWETDRPFKLGAGLPVSAALHFLGRMICHWYLLTYLLTRRTNLLTYLHLDSKGVLFWPTFFTSVTAAMPLPYLVHHASLTYTTKATTSPMAPPKSCLSAGPIALIDLAR